MLTGTAPAVTGILRHRRSLGGDRFKRDHAYAPLGLTRFNVIDVRSQIS